MGPEMLARVAHSEAYALQYIDADSIERFMVALHKTNPYRPQFIESVTKLTTLLQILTYESPKLKQELATATSSGIKQYQTFL